LYAVMVLATTWVFDGLSCRWVILIHDMLTQLHDTIFYQEIEALGKDTEQA